MHPVFLGHRLRGVLDASVGRQVEVVLRGEVDAGEPLAVFQGSLGRRRWCHGCGLRIRPHALYPPRFEPVEYFAARASNDLPGSTAKSRRLPWSAATYFKIIPPVTEKTILARGRVPHQRPGAVAGICSGSAPATTGAAAETARLRDSLRRTTSRTLPSLPIDIETLVCPWVPSVRDSMPLDGNLRTIACLPSRAATGHLRQAPFCNEAGSSLLRETVVVPRCEVTWVEAGPGE